MKRVLITGAAGFVGTHLLDALRADAACEVWATSKHGHGECLDAMHTLDVLDKVGIARTIAEFVPTHVVHLAGLAAPSIADAKSDLVWQLNLFGSLNVANAIMKHAPRCWLIWIGSGLVYGATGQDGTPLNEDCLLAPTNLYAASKAAADLALGSMAQQGLRVVRARPFNHTGASQTEDFVVPGFAAQIARIEAGKQPPIINVGNLAASRDFLDVADVVAAYRAIIATTRTLRPGQIFNVCSGEPQTISDILDALVAQSRVPIDIRQDPARLRPSDTPVYVGDAARLTAATGWQPEISFGETLKRVLDDWRRRMA